MKRFWREASVTATDDYFTIVLDAKPMRLPGGPALRLASRPLAHAIAEEWQNAPENFDASAVPLTRLAGTAQEKIAPDPAATAAAIARYALSDALCYRAEQPEALVIEQHHAWQPWLDWAHATHGARLRTTAGIMPIDQPPEALAALHAATAALPPEALAALAIIVPALGSLVLGLAVAANRLAAAAAHDLSSLDDRYQERLWGEDAEATARRANILRDLNDAEKFWRLAGGAT